MPTLTFTDIVLTGLVRADRESESDPYVTISTADASGMTTILRTPVIRNEQTYAHWAGPFEAHVVDIGSLTLHVIDSDRGTDDPMGEVITPLGAVNVTFLQPHPRHRLHSRPWPQVVFTLPEPLVDGSYDIGEFSLHGVRDAQHSRMKLTVSVVGTVVAPSVPNVPATALSPPPLASSSRWWEMALPVAPVVRKEVRKMSAVEQGRVYRAYMKMRENQRSVDGTVLRGSSQWCRLASYHGGFPGVQGLPSYCAHGRENFPNWHRPYLLDFEQMLRRADLALGGDGMIGLPYWGWEEMVVNGEVMPAMIRRMCDEIDAETRAKMDADDPTALDFYPGPWENRDGHYWLGYKKSTRSSADEFERIPDDAQLKRLLESANVREQAQRSLHMRMHRQHASSTYSKAREAQSIEQPHGTVHVYTGDVMKSHRSSFHPLFWMHHANIDRYYQSYIEDEGYQNCKAEFQRHQRRRQKKPEAGYPDGPWGRLEPFHTNGVPAATTEATIADTTPIGYRYDSLPTKQLSRMNTLMREAPYYAVFEQIRVASLERPCAVFVYVYDKTTQWRPPDATSEIELLDGKGFAGSGSIFFFALPDAVCENCVGREPFDLRVEVTSALREANLHPKRAGLGVMVSDDSGAIRPVEQTKVPAPTLRGPHFFHTSSSLTEGQPADEDDVASLQQLLVAMNLKETDVIDGAIGPRTDAAIRRFQRESGITEDGIAGPITRRRLVSGNLSADFDAHGHGKGRYAKGSIVRWYLDRDSVPLDLPVAQVEAELGQAFAVWAKPSGIRFVRCAHADKAHVAIAFADRTSKNRFLFDGPGGALAEASADSITFDESERWTLTSGTHKERKPFTWDDQEFELLTIAVHEIGHVLGLEHSDAPADVMNPFYTEGRIKLTPNDLANLSACIPCDAPSASARPLCVCELL